MVITDKESLTIALSVESASPHESRLVDGATRSSHTDDLLERIMRDKAYDSDSFDKELKERYRIELIAPHESNKLSRATQDGRAFRRSKRR